ncbi:selenide, water dikinase SelD [Nitriliruptoraceae bacterium ZYF776]|nr:selenide, water dikinase SelD [Profundirhabdus halotolerans]
MLNPPGRPAPRRRGLATVPRCRATEETAISDATALADLPRLTSLSHAAGCGCKLSLDELTDVLAGVVPTAHPDLLVGHGSGDDAAVWDRPDGRALVATTDFFTPIVDDPDVWGRVAAANAVSDVYAMGARPLFALNLVAWPRDLPFAVLRQVLAGGAAIAAEAGYPAVGGHTIDGAEPLFGQAVVGEVDRDRVLTNAGAVPGQALVLTKAIGTGVVTTATKRHEVDAVRAGGALATPYAAAVASMTRLNRRAAEVGADAGATAATDVTGFGLLGHLHRMAAASGVAAELHADAVPVLPGVRDLLADGYVPGGSQRNADQAGRYLDGEVDDDLRLLLADAQTSGGLLLACDPSAADAAVAALVADGHDAARVGRVLDGPAGTVRVRG